MKKSTIFSSLVLGTILFFSITSVSAQVDVAQVSPGMTPANPFYFLDIWGEKLEEFFTFDKTAKAKLQVKFAKERVAEINVLINQGEQTNETAVDKAKTLLLGNVAKAAEIIKEQKASGKDVAQLAKDIDDSFDQQEELLTKSFLQARKDLREGRIKSKEALLDQARQNGDTNQVTKLEKEINKLKDVDNTLRVEKDKIKLDLRDKKKDIEKEMDQMDQEKDHQERIQKDHEEEKQEQDFEQEVENEEKENKESKESKENKENNENKNSTEEKENENDSGQKENESNKVNNQNNNSNEDNSGQNGNRSERD